MSTLVSQAAEIQRTSGDQWPDVVDVYESLDIQKQLLDQAASASIQAYLRMCKIRYRCQQRSNAEYMSPGGLPFIRVGPTLIADFEPFVEFLQIKGKSLSADLEPGQRAELKAYLSLVANTLDYAELYLSWTDRAVREATLRNYGSQHPWPLNKLIGWQKYWQVQHTTLKAAGWSHKPVEEVAEDIQQCCRVLSQRLGDQYYFYLDRPTELDALVYGHISTLLASHQLLGHSLISDIVHNYENLVTFCERVRENYFDE